MIIGTVLKDRSHKDKTVKNVPYKKHDHPCWEGCCENELSIGIRELSQTGWLLRVYMKEHGLSEFDFNNWSDELESQWKKWRETRMVIKKG